MGFLFLNLFFQHCLQVVPFKIPPDTPDFLRYVVSVSKLYLFTINSTSRLGVYWLFLWRLRFNTDCEFINLINVINDYDYVLPPPVWKYQLTTAVVILSNIRFGKCRYIHDYVLETHRRASRMYKTKKVNDHVHVMRSCTRLIQNESTIYMVWLTCHWLRLVGNRRSTSLWKLLNTTIVCSPVVQ